MQPDHHRTPFACYSHCHDNIPHAVRGFAQEIMATQPRASHRMPIEAGAVPLSRHSYGCRVIQRVLEHCDMRDVRAELMACLLGATRTLAQDTYGNYVIQHILEHGSEADR